MLSSESVSVCFVFSLVTLRQRTCVLPIGRHCQQGCVTTHLVGLLTALTSLLPVEVRGGE